jgi:hypothetical protein
LPRSSSVCARWAVGDKDAAAVSSGFHRVTRRCVAVALAASQPGDGLHPYLGLHSCLSPFPHCLA